MRNLALPGDILSFGISIMCALPAFSLCYVASFFGGRRRLVRGACLLGDMRICRRENVVNFVLNVDGCVADVECGRDLFEV